MTTPSEQGTHEKKSKAERVGGGGLLTIFAAPNPVQQNKNKFSLPRLI